MNLSDFTGYILAGGKSSRMKRDKAFLKIGKRTFLENAVEILKPNCERLKIVLNKSQTHFIEQLPDNIPHIFDIYENCGALGGIHAAFKDCKTKFAIILAVDLPFIISEAIEKLCELAVNSKDFSAIVPRQNDDRLQPLCAVYRVEDCLPTIENRLINNSSFAVRDFINRLPRLFVSQEKIFIDEQKNLFYNVNEPNEYYPIKNLNI